MNRYRPATEADVDAILPLMERYYAEDGYGFDTARARAAAITLAADESLGGLWVAVVEGRVAGYLAVTLGFSLEYGGFDAFLDEVYIDTAFRRQGLGREAIDVAVDYCRARGVRALHLEVEDHREAAKRLYEAAGFELHDRHLMSRLL
ncbi:MAG: GNAT family N-acetyltransferase [Woeseiaceae bacterium]|nr:GNAT family N-acetyltransferase [Woeseiaceae bacterium]